MSEELPEPLVPADVDLRDFSFMPLEVARLRDSNLSAVPDGEVFRANILSWCVAWHQVPAASLPDDDPTLARMLGYGRDLRTWRKVRAGGGLRGWIKCSDGRLYHPIVAEIARRQWERKVAQRQRTEAARNAKLQRQSQDTGDLLLQRTAQTSVTGVLTDSKGEGEGEVRERKKDSSPTSSARPPDDAQAAVEAWNEMAEPIGLTQVQRLTEARKRLIAARLRDAGGIEGLRIAFAKVAGSPVLRGERNGNGHVGWKADFDFVLRESSFVKLMEGKYDDREGGSGAPLLGRGARGNGIAAAAAELERRLEERDRGQPQPGADG